MRTIKFRLRSKKTKKITGYEMLFDGQWAESGDGINWQPLKTNPDALREQFTGLKDKNGTEIYSGDLVNCKDEEIWHEDGQVFEVHWDNKTCGFKLKTKDKMTGCWPLDEVGEMEVIGNIMENKELLK